MREVNFKEILAVDNISQEKSWMKVYEKLKDIKEDILINFDGVNVVEPWRFKTFQMLLTKNPHIYFTFTNKEDIVSKLHMSCIINGVNTDRVRSVIIKKERVKTAEELKIEKKGKEIAEHFEIENNVAIIKIYDLYSQLHNSGTIAYIKSAIKEINGEKEIKEFVIDLGNISVQLNVLKYLATMIIDYESDGISIAVDTISEQIAKDIKLFLHQCKNEVYNDKFKRLNKIKSAITANTPGIFLRYKSSRALDDFGRHGKGEVVSSRVAILRKIRVISRKSNTTNTSDDLKDARIIVYIDTYNSDYFYTKLHWMLEHDNEELNKLHVESYEVDIEELGFCDDFIGSKYHFMLPIQKDKKESKPVLIGLNENGRNIKKICTIPERMKLVFDDWGVVYNKKILDQSIELTRKRFEDK